MSEVLAFCKQFCLVILLTKISIIGAFAGSLPTVLIAFAIVCALHGVALYRKYKLTELQTNIIGGLFLIQIICVIGQLP